MTKEIVLLKLGGSLITDKDTPYTPRLDKLKELALEIKTVLDSTPELLLILGHGSGSFGHVAAKKHGTRDGVHTAEQCCRPLEYIGAVGRSTLLRCPGHGFAARRNSPDLFEWTATLLGGATNPIKFLAALTCWSSLATRPLSASEPTMTTFLWRSRPIRKLR